jgi:hypothetical protein
VDAFLGHKISQALKVISDNCLSNLLRALAFAVHHCVREKLFLTSERIRRVREERVVHVEELGVAQIVVVLVALLAIRTKQVVVLRPIRAGFVIGLLEPVTLLHQQVDVCVECLLGV